MNEPALPELDFLFMRHGHSVDNFMRRIPHPEKCEGLSEIGRQQVLEAITALRQHSEQPEVIFTSPLTRARTTADMIGEALGLPVQPIPDLREHELGDWVGLPSQEIEPFFASRTDPPQGETYAAFYARIQNGLAKLAREPGRKLVVSHGGVWHGIKALHGDLTTGWPPNASIARVRMHDNKLEPQQLFAPHTTMPLTPPVLSAS